jgi:hypothetical protein
VWKIIDHSIVGIVVQDDGNVGLLKVKTIRNQDSDAARGERGT